MGGGRSGGSGIRRLLWFGVKEGLFWGKERKGQVWWWRVPGEDIIRDGCDAVFVSKGEA